MALDTFNPYLFVSAGEQSNKFLTPAYADGIAQFQAQRAQELTGLTVRIEGVQEGTGDPSPENIRPISGRTGLTVTVQSGETQNEYSVTWETEAGTVYGGTLDVVTGVLTVTHSAVLISGLTWTYNSTYTRFGTSLTGLKTGYITRGVPLMCEAYQTIDDGRLLQDVPDNSIYGAGSTNTIYIKTTDYSTVSDFVTAMGDYKIIYPLATPQTVQLDPEQIMTLPGFNQVYSDAGPVIDIQF